ncbi:MAG: hypothetical protein IPI73_17030 [Betaproteobacteria bacterium]|nr:hypothetical protein [Betaproteobacteria bacterium]
MVGGVVLPGPAQAPNQAGLLEQQRAVHSPVHIDGRAEALDAGDHKREELSQRRSSGKSELSVECPVAIVVANVHLRIRVAREDRAAVRERQRAGDQPGRVVGRGVGDIARAISERRIDIACRGAREAKRQCADNEQADAKQALHWVNSGGVEQEETVRRSMMIANRILGSPEGGPLGDTPVLV